MSIDKCAKIRRKFYLGIIGNFITILIKFGKFHYSRLDLRI